MVGGNRGDLRNLKELAELTQLQAPNLGETYDWAKDTGVTDAGVKRLAVLKQLERGT